MSGGWRWVATVIALTAVMAGCQERLTSPADCPAFCPAGTPKVFDTIIPAAQDRDSSFTGYVGRGRGTALLTSNGFAASEDRAIYRFVPRGDSIAVRDTLRSYTVDSVLFSLTIVARDTQVNGLSVYLYRLPSTVDSTAVFADIEPLLTDANLIDRIAVPDSVNSGAITTMLRGADAARVALLPGGDSVLAIGVRMAADAPTGIRLGSLASSSAATFTSYVTVDVPDSGSLRHQTLSRATGFNTFVTQDPVVPVDSLLTVGGEPSSRALVRFGLSDQFLDSFTIVRATLELVPVRPIIRLPTDPSVLQALAVVGDLGAKSPLTTDATFIHQDTLPEVQSDTVRMELTRIVQLWQSTRSRPQSVFLRIAPEAATFARAVFSSTRTPALGVPRLRITYHRSFPFENP